MALSLKREETAREPFWRSKGLVAISETDYEEIQFFAVERQLAEGDYLQFEVCFSCSWRYGRKILRGRVRPRLTSAASCLARLCGMRGYRRPDLALGPFGFLSQELRAEDQVHSTFVARQDNESVQY